MLQSAFLVCYAVMQQYNNNMRKRTVLLLVSLAIAVIVTVAPYARYSYVNWFYGMGGRPIENYPRLLDGLIVGPDSFANILLLLPAIFPLLLVIESFVFKLPFRLGTKILFLIQGLIVLWGMTFDWVHMTLIGDRYLPVYYLLLFVGVVFPLWSILLIIPRINKVSFIRSIFS
jgi:hypothetical protein